MLCCTVYLPRHKSGRNKGFGFTTFETEDELNVVLQVLILCPYFPVISDCYACRSLPKTYQHRNPSCHVVHPCSSSLR